MAEEKLTYEQAMARIAELQEKLQAKCGAKERIILFKKTGKKVRMVRVTGNHKPLDLSEGNVESILSTLDDIKSIVAKPMPFDAVPTVTVE